MSGWQGSTSSNFHVLFSGGLWSWKVGTQSSPQERANDEILRKSGFMDQLLPASGVIFGELCPLCEPQFSLSKMGFRITLILWGVWGGSNDMSLGLAHSSRPSVKFESEKFTWYSEIWVSETL